jgi:hypothetical protein
VRLLQNCLCTLRLMKSSARVSPTHTAAICAPLSLAVLARRKAEYTISEDPTTSSPSASATSCSALHMFGPVAMASPERGVRILT